MNTRDAGVKRTTENIFSTDFSFLSIASPPPSSHTSTHASRYSPLRCASIHSTLQTHIRNTMQQIDFYAFRTRCFRSRSGSFASHCSHAPRSPLSQRTQTTRTPLNSSSSIRRSRSGCTNAGSFKTSRIATSCARFSSDAPLPCTVALIPPQTGVRVMSVAFEQPFSYSQPASWKPASSRRALALQACWPQSDCRGGRCDWPYRRSKRQECRTGVLAAQTAGEMLSGLRRCCVVCWATM